MQQFAHCLGTSELLAGWLAGLVRSIALADDDDSHSQPIVDVFFGKPKNFLLGQRPASSREKLRAEPVAGIRAATIVSANSMDNQEGGGF